MDQSAEKGLVALKEYASLPEEALRGRKAEIRKTLKGVWQAAQDAGQAGRKEEAESVLREAAALLVSLAGTDFGFFGPWLGSAWARLGYLYVAEKRTDEIADCYRKAAGVDLELFGKDPAFYAPRLGNAAQGLAHAAWLAVQQGRTDDACALYREAGELLLKPAEYDPESYVPKLDHNRRKLAGLAARMRKEGRTDDAVRLYAGLAEGLPEAAPDAFAADCAKKAGDLCRKAGRDEEAAAFRNAAAAVWLRDSGAGTGSPEQIRDRIAGLSDIASDRFEQADYTGAEECYLAALEDSLALIRLDPSACDAVHGACRDAGRFADYARRYCPAVQAERLSLRLLEARIRLAELSPSYERDLIGAYDRLGDCCRAAGRKEEAAAYYQRALLVCCRNPGAYGDLDPAIREKKEALFR